MTASAGKVARAAFFPMLVLLLGGTPQFGRAADPALFRVGGKSYTIKDIAGVTEEELRKRFRSEIKGMSEKDMLRRIGDEKTAELAKVPPNQRKATLEEMVYHDARYLVLLRALHTFVLAEIAENIIKEQGIAVEEYFDMELLRSSMKKQVRFMNQLAKTLDQKETDDALLAELNRELGIKWEKKWWTDLRERTRQSRQSHPLSHWGAEFCRRSPLFEEVALKAVLAHALVKDSCLNGSYHRQAKQLTAVRQSLFAVYEVDGFQGEKRALEKFFQAVTDDRGVIRQSAVESFIESLRTVSRGIEFRFGVRSGAVLTKDLTIPPIGQLVEVRSGSYQILGYLKRTDPPPDDGKREHSFWNLTRTHAFELAAGDLFPPVVIYAKEFASARAFVQSRPGLGTDGILLTATEMHRGEYVKKKYPAELFDAFRETSANLHTFTAEAARLAGGNDRKGAQALVERLTALAKRPAPKLVQQRYGDMAIRLAKQFQLEPPPADR